MKLLIKPIYHGYLPPLSPDYRERSLWFWNYSGGYIYANFGARLDWLIRPNKLQTIELKEIKNVCGNVCFLFFFFFSNESKDQKGIKGQKMTVLPLSNTRAYLHRGIDLLILGETLESLFSTLRLIEKPSNYNFFKLQDPSIDKYLFMR